MVVLLYISFKFLCQNVITFCVQLELAEAVRLYEVNEEDSLSFHIFVGIPTEPGLLCPGEHKIYR